MCLEKCGEHFKGKADEMKAALGEAEKALTMAKINIVPEAAVNIVKMARRCCARNLEARLQVAEKWVGEEQESNTLMLDEWMMAEKDLPKLVPGINSPGLWPAAW